MVEKLEEEGRKERREGREAGGGGKRRTKLTAKSSVDSGEFAETQRKAKSEGPGFHRTQPLACHFLNSKPSCLKSKLSSLDT